MWEEEEGVAEEVVVSAEASAQRGMHVLGEDNRMLPQRTPVSPSSPS